MILATLPASSNVRRSAGEYPKNRPQPRRTRRTEPSRTFGHHQPARRSSGTGDSVGGPGLHTSRDCPADRVLTPVITCWCQRFQAQRLDGLLDMPGRGRKPFLPLEAVRRVLEQVTQPRIGEPRWNCRSMARAAGISATSVHKLWAANDLKPHLPRTFKLSNDPNFEDKFWDVIGLYLNKALVLCCDEISQVQALERTQPGLPLGIGHIRTQSHDYVRHGTVTLFTALDYRVLFSKKFTH